MSELVYHRKTCRLCGSSNLLLALPLTPTPLADSYVPKNSRHLPQPAYPLDLYLCADCSFVQLLEIIIPKAIYLDYIYETVSSLGLVKHFEHYASYVVQAVKPSKNALVIDIGSNDGTLLRHFLNHGMRVLGIDPAIDIANRATQSGIETMADFFTYDLATQIREKKGPASVITANNLYANVDELESLTIAIRDLLDADGVFIFESFYLADWMKNLVFDFAYHEHLSYFSVKPLKHFFNRLQMELIDVIRVDTKGGSIRCTVQRAGGPRLRSTSVDRFIAEEQSLGIDAMPAFRDFQARISEARGNVLGYVKSLIASGKNIAGYGASATTTTLLYHFDLNDKLSFIADDYPAKQNLYTPGHHIPVLGPESLYQRKPDYVLILAWRYAEPIMQNHQAFLDQGGAFIVPLPDLKIFSHSNISSQ